MSPISITLPGTQLTSARATQVKHRDVPSPAVTQPFSAPRVPKITLEPPKTVYSPFAPAQVYSFTGQLSNTSQTQAYHFFVLAGASRPNITGGWAKINIVDRPMRKGFTIPSGYDPITLDIPVQFEALTQQPTGKYMITPDVEGDIQKLEWMAGRGKLFSSQPGSVGQAATGNPPIVTVASFTSAGSQSNLIPPNLNGVTWIIANIVADTDGYSDSSGNRLRQAMMISLTEFVPVGAELTASPTARAKGRNSATATPQVVVATAGMNTIGKITEKATGSTDASIKQAVIAANATQLGIRSWNQVLTLGTKVTVPANYLTTGPYSPTSQTDLFQQAQVAG